MKLSLLAFLFASVSAHTITGENARNLIKKARRLEDRENGENGENGENAAAQGEYSFLMNYKLKLRYCKSGEAVRNPQNGQYDFNVVSFRLCPEDSCSDSGSEGCDEGYGDYVVGLENFIESYMEEQDQNMDGDDDFDLKGYAKCQEYDQDWDQEEEEREGEGEEGNNNNNNYYANNAERYWTGPACSDDGTDIVMKLFSDQQCSEEPEGVTFEQISNGWSLPYSDGGLVSSYCLSCVQYDDDGNYDVKDFCQELYENAGKCERQMEFYHYYGRQTESCNYIKHLFRNSVGGAGKVIGWLVFIAILGSGAAYVLWWKKRKAANRDESLLG